MLKNYSRVFVGRPVDKPGWFAGSIKLQSGPKDSGWRPVTVRLKQGCRNIDNSNLPAILRVDNEGCTMTFENDGKMICAIIMDPANSVYADNRDIIIMYFKEEYFHTKTMKSYSNKWNLNQYWDRSYAYHDYSSHLYNTLYI